LRALLAVGIFTRVNALLLTATLGVAILQNILADRDPQLAIVYVLVMLNMAFLGGGKLSLDARLFSRRQQTAAAFQNKCVHTARDAIVKGKV
jgi:uncharacterized membrane protein YphA (DoxX/SURF4 family)